MGRSTDALDAALDYLRRGLPITLCDGKKPLGNGWTKSSNGRGWQNHRWSVNEIERAFRTRGALNVGLRFGPGDLIDFEADNPKQEQAAAELFDGDFPVTPTFQARRGKHRLFAWHPDLAKIGKAVADFKGLGIRIGCDGKGAQSIIPPSVADGVKREWLVSLDECDPAQLSDSVVRQIIEANTNGKRTRLHSRHSEHRTLLVSAVSTAPTVSTVLSEAVEWAISRTLPTSEGERNRLLFDFARHLKAIPSLAAADLPALVPYLQQWHERALTFISTKGFTETRLDFVNAWKRVKYPHGQEPIAMIYHEAITGAMPSAAARYPEIEVKRLVALCWLLQRTAGDNPFFLACRTAGDLLGVSHVQAHKWLQALVLDKVLAVVTVGTRHKASEYRYLVDAG